MSPTVRSLRIHASYACQRTGVCCASNWPIPVESDRIGGLSSALGDRRLIPVIGSPDEAVLAPPPGASSSVAGVLGRANRRCVFLSPGAPCTCRVHADLGHAALPLACRQFPRIAVRDPRGVSVTLSHYCPTAAALLDHPHDGTIVTAPDAFPADGEYDGLDAARALPPLLRPDLLMDWDAWWAWERLAVELVMTEESLPTSVPTGSLALGRLAVGVERLRQWRPADGPLGGRVLAVMDEIRALDARPFAPGPDETGRRVGEVVGATPAEVADAHRTTLGDARAMVSAHAARGFLAAHAFANWHIQLGQGLRTWLRSVEAASAFLQSGVGVGQADLWLRHLADVNRLATVWSETERT